MTQRDLTEHTLASEPVFDGKLLKVKRDRVRLPDGKAATREYIDHPGAAAIIALDGQGGIVMVRQFRYPMRREFLELPAGKIDSGEAPLATAQRELEEETGYRATQWKELMTLHPVIAYSNERIVLFEARGLARHETRLDEGEFVETMVIPLTEAHAMVHDGRITDAKTVIGLLWVTQFGADA
jgi:ADP-ribose pyrophosphatase